MLLEQEANSALISFEMWQNENKTDNIQSFELSFDLQVELEGNLLRKKIN